MDWGRTAKAANEAAFSAMKAAIWAYDVHHHAFGGGGDIVASQSMDAAMITPEENRTKGEIIAAAYTSAFLRWHLLGETDQRAMFTGEAFPPEVEDPDFWIYHPDYIDLGLSAVSCNAQTEPACATLSLCRWDADEEDCEVIATPLIKHVFSDQEIYRRVVATFPQDPEVETSGITESTASTTFSSVSIRTIAAGTLDGLEDTTAYAQHNDVLSVNWRGAGLDPSGSISFNFPFAENLVEPGLNNLSLKVGIITEAIGGAGSCVPHSDSPLSFNVTLIGEDGEQRTVDVDGILQQEVQSVESLAGVSHCAGRWFLQTIRIPFREFCFQSEQPLFPLNAVEEIRIHLADLSEEFTIHIDSIEFTNNPLDDDDDACLIGSNVWRCEATSTLAAVETSCNDTPILGVCPSGSVQTTAVAVPAVPQSLGGAFSGWVVEGAVTDPDNPTSGELAALEVRCADACALEYWEPPLSANCTAPGAFQTPTLASGSGVPTRRQIATAFEDGRGLFSGESLACDLETDCCSDGFDEDLCAAVAARSTVAQSALGRGQEWVLDLLGSISVKSEDDGIVASASITGSIGYTRCGDASAYTAQNGNDACPFYLGSAHFELTETLSLNVDCDGVVVPLSLNDLTIDLMQPAFGIDSAAASAKAFPPGSLVLASQIDAGGIGLSKLDVNREPVFFDATDGWVSAQGTGGLVVDFQLYCNGQVEQMSAWLAFESTSAQAQPPAITIDMSTEVSCPSTETLSAPWADPDGDVVSIRWWADGVLLAPSVTSIDVDGTVVLRAQARDVRGATATDLHTISCATP